MPLTEKQVEELKKQLLEQVKHLPPEKKAEAEEQIENMSAEALETMIEQQKAQTNAPRRNDIFRMIVEKVIPSKQIDENKEAIAVIDIRPITRGHVIVIPKKQVLETKELSSSTLNFAKNIAKKISLKLKTKSIEIQTERKFGEIVINLIPIYEKPASVSSERYEAKDTELEQVFNLLKKVKKEKIEKVRTEKKKNQEGKILQIKRRIP